VYEAAALVDTGAVRSVVPAHVADRLGLAVRGQRVAEYAGGRQEIVGVTEPLIIDWEGRDTLEEALVHGDEVILGQTVLEKLYHRGAVPLLSLDDYASLVVDCLEVLPPDTIIMRLMGDAPRQMLVAPTWSLDKRTALRRIEQELERRETYQGKYYHAPVP